MPSTVQYLFVALALALDLIKMLAMAVSVGRCCYLFDFTWLYTD